MKIRMVSTNSYNLHVFCLYYEDDFGVSNFIIYNSSFYIYRSDAVAGEVVGVSDELLSDIIIYSRHVCIVVYYCVKI